MTKNVRGEQTRRAIVESALALVAEASLDDFLSFATPVALARESARLALAQPPPSARLISYHFSDPPGSGHFAVAQLFWAAWSLHFFKDPTVVAPTVIPSSDLATAVRNTIFLLAPDVVRQEEKAVQALGDRLLALATAASCSDRSAGKRLDAFEDWSRYHTLRAFDQATSLHTGYPADVLNWELDQLEDALALFRIGFRVANNKSGLDNSVGITAAFCDSLFGKVDGPSRKFRRTHPLHPAGDLYLPKTHGQRRRGARTKALITATFVSQLVQQPIDAFFTFLSPRALAERTYISPDTVLYHFGHRGGMDISRLTRTMADIATQVEQRGMEDDAALLTRARQEPIAVMRELEPGISDDPLIDGAAKMRMILNGFAVRNPRYLDYYAERLNEMPGPPPPTADSPLKVTTAFLFAALTEGARTRLRRGRSIDVDGMRAMVDLLTRFSRMPPDFIREFRHGRK